MGRMDPTLHIGMLNRISNLEEAILTNVGNDVNFICRLSFQSDPTCMWHGSLFEQLHTHAKQKKKE
jgi:hypothetical protein